MIGDEEALVAALTLQFPARTATRSMPFLTVFSIGRSAKLLSTRPTRENSGG
jgi:hypothetical protein